MSGSLASVLLDLYVMLIFPVVIIHTAPHSLVKKKKNMEERSNRDGGKQRGEEVSHLLDIYREASTQVKEISLAKRQLS